MRVSAPISALQVGDVLETLPGQYAVVTNIYKNESGMPVDDVLRDTGVLAIGWTDGPMRQTQPFPGLWLRWEKVATPLWLPSMRLSRACEYECRP
jgi:hypothetical protein